LRLASLLIQRGNAGEFLFFVVSMGKLYQSIALDELYIFPFESVEIGRFVQPRIEAERAAFFFCFSFTGRLRPNAWSFRVAPKRFQVEHSEISQMKSIPTK
jgi:hypothetical protein